MEQHILGRNIKVCWEDGVERCVDKHEFVHIVRCLCVGAIQGKLCYMVEDLKVHGWWEIVDKGVGRN